MSGEQHIVVTIIDGTADETLVHLPAVKCGAGGGFRFDSYEFPPTSWPAACGSGSGPVYVRGGPFGRSEICGACQAVVT